MDRTVKASDDYTDKLFKVIPAEISGLFLIANGLAPWDQDAHDVMKWLILVGAFICLLYMKYIAEIRSWPQTLIISLIVFPLWSLAIIVHRVDEIYEYRYLVPVVAGAVTLFLPKIVPAEA